MFDINAATHAMLDAVVWTATDVEGYCAPASTPIDGDLERALTRDLVAFVEGAGALLDGLDPSQVGHDFWLTRNHHGAGFWDRGLGERGDRLTRDAEAYGEVDVLWEDGMIVG